MYHTTLLKRKKQAIRHAHIKLINLHFGQPITKRVEMHNANNRFNVKYKGRSIYSLMAVDFRAAAKVHRANFN